MNNVTDFRSFDKSLKELKGLFDSPCQQIGQWAEKPTEIYAIGETSLGTRGCCCSENTAAPKTFG